MVNINISAYWNMGNTQIDNSNSEKGLDDYLGASFNLVTLLEKFNLTHINLVKIDVEGRESDALQSLFDENIIPTNILFKYIPESFSNASLELDLLKEKGYTINDITVMNIKTKKIYKNKIYGLKNFRKTINSFSQFSNIYLRKPGAFSC